ncbi:hypothetical protein Taro_039002 [Colocasia esculenta]|uniref:Uncharacterized protein n=1 Tax=Colocasia esculenta TaxID=4460 RepID=A0A843WKW6_COLES|nr:hypothetical protein [Colocasia esculenta]
MQKGGFSCKKLRSRLTLVRVMTGSGRQIATSSYEDRDGSFGQAARTRQGSLSRSDLNRYLCRDGPKNVAYRAVAFSGPASPSNVLGPAMERLESIYASHNHSHIFGAICRNDDCHGSRTIFSPKPQELGDVITIVA